MTMVVVKIYTLWLFQLMLTCSVSGIFINSSKQLEEELMRDIPMTTGKVMIELDSSVEYKITRGVAYTFSNKTIVIKSDTEQFANITCERFLKISSDETSGFVFIDSVVELVRLRFTRCGKNLSTISKYLIQDVLTNTKIRSVALSFINSVVKIKSADVNSSNGFAILGYNVMKSHFQHVYIRNTFHITLKRYDTEIGSGVLLYFDDYRVTATKTSVLFKNCKFLNNINIYESSGRNCIHEEFVKGHNKVKKYFAVGLSVFYTQRLYTAEVTIDNAIFFQNAGVYAGAILILNLKHALSVTTVQGTLFYRNSLRACHGTDLQYFHLGGNTTETWRPTLTVRDTEFLGGNSGVKHTAALGAVTIELYTPTNIIYFKFVNVTFANQNTIKIEGVCLILKMFRNSKQKNIVKANLANIRVVENNIAHRQDTPKSLLYFENINRVELTDNGLFLNNLGSVIHIKEGELHMQGNMTFINNSADNGAAILGHANVQLFLKRRLKATFINNKAYYSGGAIYVRSTSYSNCAVQMKDTERELTFSGNTARTAGNDIFISPISKCKKYRTYSTSWLEKYLKYFNFSWLHQDNNLLQLSTVPSQIQIEFVNGSNTKHPHTIYAYPGQQIYIEISAKDHDRRNVFSFVSTQVFKSEDSKGITGNVWIIQSGGNRVLEQAKMTQMDLSFHTNASSFIEAIMVFSIPEVSSDAVDVKIHPCPMGFQIDKRAGNCRCSNLIASIPNTQCDINTRTILTEPHMSVWIGVLNTTLAVSSTCPLMYCRKINNSPIKFNNGGEVTLTENNKTRSFCRGERIGILCGQCNRTANHSLVFGSNDCHECSNLWLLTLVFYAVSGPLLLYFIYKLNITVTRGTINGVVFYIQASNTGVLEYLTESHDGYPTIKRVNKVLHGALALLNSNLPFRLCFYDGMDQLRKTSFGLIFPIYGVAIVIGIIVISRHSMWVSNRTAHLSVQVLVTAIHISFSKLLASLLEVFTSAKVETETETTQVWYRDGSVEYMGPAHYLLVVITIVTVSLLLIPYVTILIIGKPLIRRSKRANIYLRPVIEAVYGPYRTGKHHWFVARLILLLLLYLNYDTFRTKSKHVQDIISSVLLIVFTVIQAFAHPFNKNGLNVLDTWLMLNYTLVHGLILVTPSLPTTILVAVLMYLALATFVLVLVYHIAKATNRLKQVKDILDFVTEYIKQKPVVKLFFGNANMIQSRQVLRLQHTDSYYGSCDQYREPLLDAN